MPALLGCPLFRSARSVVIGRCTADLRISRWLPGWLSSDAVTISVLQLSTNASAVPHVRITGRSCGMHGHWELVNELTVALPVSLALRFLQLESMYEHEQYCEYKIWSGKDLQRCLARQLRYRRLD